MLCVAAVAAVVLAACGGPDETLTRSPAEPAATTSSVVQPPEVGTTTIPVSTTVVPQTTLLAPSPLRLVCDGVPLPADDVSLSGLPLAGPDEDSAWDTAASKYGVDLRGDREWRVLSKTAADLQLIADAAYDAGPTGTLTIATFTRDGDTWSPGNLTSCAARWGQEGLLNVELVEFDPSNRPSRDSTSLRLIFTDDSWPCGTGDPDSTVVVVDETAETVAVVVLVEPAADASPACPASVVSITVPLANPLGDRAVVDASTEPARPLTVFRPEQRLQVILAGPSVLGWWDSDMGEWIDADPLSPAIPLAPGTELQVTSLDGPRPAVISGPPVRDCGPAQSWTVSLEPVVDWGAETLAVNATWPLTPRPLTVLSPTIPDYQQVIVDYLARRGIVDVPVQVDQVIRVDLDGDGVDEVLVSAHHPEATNLIGAQAGFFSVVLLRRVDGGAVDTVGLFEDLHLVADTVSSSMLIGDVSGVGDLNGDGIMEIATKWRYFEGAGVDIFDVAPGAPVKVLGTTCGS